MGVSDRAGLATPNGGLFRAAKNPLSLQPEYHLLTAGGYRSRGYCRAVTAHLYVTDTAGAVTAQDIAACGRRYYTVTAGYSLSTIF